MIMIAKHEQPPRSLFLIYMRVAPNVVFRGARCPIEIREIQ
jgi:hypothetical protein